MQEVRQLYSNIKLQIKDKKLRKELFDFYNSPNEKENKKSGDGVVSGVDFAREYPAFYAITYEIYHRLNHKLSLFEDGDDINYLMHLGYSGFMNQMTKPIVEKFIEHLMGTRFKDVIEPALNRLK